MRLRLLAAILGSPLILAPAAGAQDLAPRAYVITPVNSNAVNMTWAYYNGGVNLNGAAPIQDAQGIYNVVIPSYYHALNFFGRSSNFTVALPYAVGNFTGDVFGIHHSVYRSGLLDFSGRFAVNLLGGPAMNVREFSKWKQKRILGASLKIIAPTGQYDPTKLINWGINRWAFKPELGYSQRWGHWFLDTYGGVWFYTTNQAHFAIPKPAPQTEEPIGSFEGHLSYDVQKLGIMKRLRGWASVDGNFWWGGITALNGIRAPNTKQTSSRIGCTVSIPYSKHQSVKIAYSDGTYIRFGGNYQAVQVSWQYSWFGTKFR